MPDSPDNSIPNRPTFDKGVDPFNNFTSKQTACVSFIPFQDRVGIEQDEKEALWSDVLL